VEPVTNILSLHFIYGIIAVIIIALGIFYTIKRKNKTAFFGIAWFLLFYAPVSGIFPVAYLVADRYMYMPLLGLLIFFFSVFRMPLKKLAAITMIIVGILSVLYIQREHLYANPLILWETVVEKYPNTQIGWNNYGLELSHSKRYEEAEDAFKKSIENDPEYYKAYNNLGALYNRMNRLKEAKWNFLKAYELTPEDPRPLYFAGIIALRMNDTIGGIRVFFDLINSKHKNFAAAWMYLGLIYTKTKEYDKAIMYLNSALKMDPDNKNLANELMKLYVQTGDTLTAKEIYYKYLLNK